MSVPVTLSRHLTRAGLLITAAAGAATLAAGCGSQVATTPARPSRPAPPAASPGVIIPGGPASPGSTALCSTQVGVTRLVVSRVTGLPRNHLHFAFPAGVTVSSPARARAVAAAVCGLPPMPRGPMSCPVDLGLGYRLSFAAGSRSFPVVTVTPGGCGGVAGPGRSAGRPARRGSGPSWPTAWASARGTALRGTSPARPSATPVRPHTSPLKHSSPAG